MQAYDAGRGVGVYLSGTIYLKTALIIQISKKNLFPRYKQAARKYALNLRLT